LHITNATNWPGPDGVRKHAMLINSEYPLAVIPRPISCHRLTILDQFPGPTIEAEWGDYIVVNVYNDLQDNG